MKLSLIGAMLALISCSRPMVTVPQKTDAAEDLKTKTVAMVVEDTDQPGGASAYCTGVWVSPTSILTANHCTHGVDIGESFFYSVVTDVYSPSDKYTPRTPIMMRVAQLYARDEMHDLVLMRALVPPGHGTAEVSTSEIRTGMYAQEMGMSFGLWFSYSSGDVAAVRVYPSITTDLPVLFVQTTAPTSPGNSGGGLYDEENKLIGICHGGFIAESNAQNINFFTHPTYIRAFLDGQGKAL